jgi:adenylosuccinate lyase
MIKRYSVEDITRIWSDENKFHIHSVLEIVHLCIISGINDLDKIKDLIDKYTAVNENDVSYIRKIEDVTRHETVAFIKFITERLQESDVKADLANRLHFGLTSSDILDATIVIQMNQSLDLLTKLIQGLKTSLDDASIKYKEKQIMGRTHGQFAEPIPLSKIFDLHKQELMSFVLEPLPMKIRGPVGERTNITKDEEEEIIRISAAINFGVNNYFIPEFVNQAIGRDSIASWITKIAILASNIEKFTTNIRLYSRSDCGEITEGFLDGQFGSSSMPHKRNPIKSENLAGISRLIRGYALTSLENIVLWHERDMSHSSAERIILEDSFQLICYMVKTETDIVRNLRVNEEAIKKPFDVIGDGSQKIMNDLIKNGMSRFEAYSIAKSKN